MGPRRGRKPLVDDAHFLKTVVAARSDLVVGGQLAGFSEAVWKDISQNLGLRDEVPIMDVRAVYTAVKEANRCGILTHLGLAMDGGSLGGHHITEEQIVSSSSADESSDQHGSSYRETSSGDDNQPSIRFTLALSSADWEAIRPKMKTEKRTEKDRPHLRTRVRMRMEKNLWAPILSAAVYSSHRLPCTWSFKRAEVTPGSHLKYVSIIGSCKDQGCKITAVLPAAPTSKSEAVFAVNVSGKFGENHHGNKKRQLKGKDRERLVEKMVESNIPACEIRRSEAAKSMRMGDPGDPHIPSAVVLRVAKHLRSKRDRRHDDPFTAVSLLKFSSEFSTTIQTLSWYPFSLHYWTTDQMRMYIRYVKCCKPNQSLPKVFIDATGGVVRKLARPDGSRSGPVFLYHVVIRNGGQQFPVCQMLTESHNAGSIAFWLQEWVRLGATKPRMAVSDFSLALLYGMVRAFTGCADVKDYIRRCFCAIKAEGEPPECLIRLDIAHFMKMVRSSEPMKKMSRLVKEFYLRSIGLLIRSDNMDAARVYLGAIFTVALSETVLTEGVQVGSVDAVKKFLQREIAAADLSVVAEVGEAEYDYNDVTEFESWAEQLRDEITADLRDGGGDPNAFHSPELVKYLVRLCKSFPLWSALMDKRCGRNDGSVASSASVESEFNDLKTRVFGHSVTLPARLDDFFKHHVGSIEGKILLASSELNAGERASDEEQPTAAYEDSVMSCPACAAGNFPPENGAHQCFECGSPIHPFDKCSFLVGDKDEHPQKRVCRSCHTKPNDRSDHLYSQMQGSETDTCEDWRGLGIGEHQKKKRRHSYAFPNPEFGYKDLSDTKRICAAFPVLQNGHLIRLQPKSVGSVEVSLSNTCAFDSIVHAIAAAVKLSAVYSDALIGYVCPLTQIGFRLASRESHSSLYEKRTELIYEKYHKTSRMKTLPDGTISINCETTVPALLNDMIIIRSAMSSSTCDDPGRLCPWKDQSIGLQVVTIPEALITRATFENFDVNQIVPGPSICHQPFSLIFDPEALSNFAKNPASYMTVDPAYDNGRPVCNGIRSHELKFQSPHIFIEVEPTGGHISGDIVVPTKLIRLDSIPERLVIGKQIYALRAVIECDAPARGAPKLCSMSHYRTYSPLGGDNWIRFDDNKPKSDTVNAGVTVSCQVLMYTV